MKKKIVPIIALTSILGVAGLASCSSEPEIVEKVVEKIVEKEVDVYHYSVSAEASDVATLTPSATSAKKGDKVTVEVVPTEGATKTVKGIDGGEGVEVVKGEDGKYSFTMPGRVVVLKAVTEDVLYAVSVEQDAAIGKLTVVDAEGKAVEKAAVGTELIVKHETVDKTKSPKTVKLGLEPLTYDGAKGGWPFVMPAAEAKISVTYEDKMSIVSVVDEKGVVGEFGSETHEYTTKLTNIPADEFETPTNFETIQGQNAWKLAPGTKARLTIIRSDFVDINNNITGIKLGDADVTFEDDGYMITADIVVPEENANITFTFAEIVRHAVTVDMADPSAATFWGVPETVEDGAQLSIQGMLATGIELGQYSQVFNGDDEVTDAIFAESGAISIFIPEVHGEVYINLDLVSPLKESGLPGNYRVINAFDANETAPTYNSLTIKEDGSFEFWRQDTLSGNVQPIIGWDDGEDGQSLHYRAEENDFYAESFEYIEDPKSKVEVAEGETAPEVGEPKVAWTLEVDPVYNEMQEIAWLNVRFWDNSNYNRATRYSYLMAAGRHNDFELADAHTMYEFDEEKTTGETIAYMNHNGLSSYVLADDSGIRLVTLTEVSGMTTAVNPSTDSLEVGSIFTFEDGERTTKLQTFGYSNLEFKYPSAEVGTYTPEAVEGVPPEDPYVLDGFGNYTQGEGETVVKGTYKFEAFRNMFVFSPETGKQVKYVLGENNTLKLFEATTDVLSGYSFYIDADGDKTFLKFVDSDQIQWTWGYYNTNKPCVYKLVDNKLTVCLTGDNRLVEFTVDTTGTLPTLTWVSGYYSSINDLDAVGTVTVSRFNKTFAPAEGQTTVDNIVVKDSGYLDMGAETVKYDILKVVDGKAKVEISGKFYNLDIATLTYTEALPDYTLLKGQTFSYLYDPTYPSAGDYYSYKFAFDASTDKVTVECTKHVYGYNSVDDYYASLMNEKNEKEVGTFTLDEKTGDVVVTLAKGTVSFSYDANKNILKSISSKQTFDVGTIKGAELSASTTLKVK